MTDLRNARDRAIAIVEDSRRTHVQWRDYLLAHPDHPTRTEHGDVGDLAHHEWAIVNYDLVLAVLRRESDTAAIREDEEIRQLRELAHDAGVELDRLRYELDATQAAVAERHRLRDALRNIELGHLFNHATAGEYAAAVLAGQGEGALSDGA